MHILKSFTRRFCMTILFLGALFTTYHSISGVEAKNIIAFIDAKMKDDNKQAYFSLAKPTSVQTSSTKEVNIEEEFDWTKYPSKKVIATGYTAGYESTGKNPGHPEYGITYSGVKVKRDLYSTIAADLNVFPIGTVLFIPGYGYGVVADKGGAIKGNKLDLYFETVDDIYNNWGKKTVDVYVVEMGDGSLTEEELNSLNENESMQVFRQQYINGEKK